MRDAPAGATLPSCQGQATVLRIRLIVLAIFLVPLRFTVVQLQDWTDQNYQRWSTQAKYTVTNLRRLHNSAPDRIVVQHSLAASGCIADCCEPGTLP